MFGFYGIGAKAEPEVKPDPRVFEFYTEGYGVVAKLDLENGLKFHAKDQFVTKRQLAEGLVSALHYLWVSNAQTYDGSALGFAVDDGKTMLMEVTKNQIIVDDPMSPFDYWTLKLAQKYWTDLKLG